MVACGHDTQRAATYIPPHSLHRLHLFIFVLFCRAAVRCNPIQCAIAFPARSQFKLSNICLHNLGEEICCRDIQLQPPSVVENPKFPISSGSRKLQTSRRPA
ncbi:hypothetical protein BDZ91DRAFT_723612 [Kalaharituber pfeilii]|nr:hypothetical protein BDZ91DRAFT_723612 [Kalaharituber pfeilii]